MPTENRSSTIEQDDHIEGIIDMVSAPFQREDRYIVVKRSDLALLSPVDSDLAHSYLEGVMSLMAEWNCPTRECLVIESDWLEFARAWASIEARVSGGPSPQPYPEPIAWMVGTAIWWTKEEAERDAAETGLPIVGLGPMSGVAPAEQHQGEPYGWAHDDGKEFTTHADHARDLQREGIQMIPLYTRADPGEVERLHKELVESDHAFVRSATELAQCESMAAMVAEREWAEHLGTGTVSSKVEAAFTQLHNDLHEAGEKLAERDALLQRMKTLFRTDDPFDLYDAVCNALAGKS